MLLVQGLSKTYRDGFATVAGLDLEMPDDAFFGLLGPNGAVRLRTRKAQTVQQLVWSDVGATHVDREPADLAGADRVAHTLPTRVSACTAGDREQGGRW